MPISCKLPQRIEKVANQADMNVRRGIGGRYIVTSKSSRAYVGTFDSEDELRAYIVQQVNQNARDLDGGLNVPVRGEPTPANPLPMQSQLSPLRRKIALAQVGPLNVATPIKTTAQNLENLGGGKAFTKVYEPTQKARVEVNRQLTQDKFESLGGRSYQQAIHDLDKRAAELSVRDRELVTLHAESYTQEEIASGALLGRPLTDAEIEASKAIAKLGHAEDIPLLMRRNGIIDSFLENRELTLRSVQRMKNDILDGKLPPEMGAELDRLLISAGEEKTVADVMRTMGITEDEMVTMGMLRSFVEIGPDTYNIPAIYRHATAPKLEKGFKNGRDMFAAKNGMNDKLVQFSNDRMNLIDTAFSDKGYNASRLVGAQLPILRQFVDVGIYPSKQFGRSASGGVNQIADVLNSSLPESTEVFGRRILSGHLNPYELHPSVTANKHVRNMILRNTLDPEIKKAKEEVLRIFDFDERAGKIMTNYLHELEGLPHEGFDELTAKIRTIGRFIGVKIDDRLAERMVNMLVKVSSQATIPFRLALVARNLMQSPFFTAPVVGGEAWLHGVKASLGLVENGKFGFDALKDSIQRAIKAGAIDPNVLPIHASSELFGIEASTVSARLGGKVSKAAFTMRDVFDAGFTFYRYPDDWGRVVAFEAGRFRVNKYMKNYVMSGRTAKDLDRLKIDAKVKTFNEAIEAEFESLIRQDRYDDAADYIGKQLADKAHLLYGNANHPSGWGGVAGRLFGQFGTFPVQYLNYVTEGLSRGSVKDRVEFATMHSALNMGVVVAGSELFDADLQSWATFGSLTYTGGPYAEATMSLAQVMGGSDVERSLALRNLQMMFPTLDSPQSIFVPGSYFIGDMVEAYKEDNMLEQVGLASGIRFLRPSEDTWVDRAMGWVNEIQ